MYDVYYVTPVRNGVHHIDETIWSIVSQAGTLSLRYHVQDGGSTDGTLDKLARWQDYLDAHGASLPGSVTFSYATGSDDGLYHAVSLGFAQLSPPPEAWMGWLNSDDRLWPGTMEAVTSLGRQHPDVDWILGWPTIIDRHGRFGQIHKTCLLPQEVLAAGLADGTHWRFVQQESCFWRKRLWDAAGGVDISLRLAGDWDLWRRFSRHAPLVHLQAPLGQFRVRPGQMSGNLAAYFEEMEEHEPFAKRQTRQQELLTTDTFEAAVALPSPLTGRWERQLRRFKSAQSDLPPPEPRWRHLLKRTVKGRQQAPLFAPGFSWDAFTYARRSHMRVLAENYVVSATGAPLDIDYCDLKAYQDALVSAFIDQTLPPGSRILEVGGGHSRVLPLYQHTHECWNIDKFEGAGNGATDIPVVDYRLVLDYLGNSNPELPDDYFDLVFSISALEHVPEEETVHANILKDIQRVLKPGGASLHLLDIVRSNIDGSCWMHGIVPYLFRNIETANTFVPLDQFQPAEDLYMLGKTLFDDLWKPTTKKDFEVFGAPSSLTVFWRKPSVML
uniref:Methylase involved in ubiquinone/menaquinone biosynthesis n=1 Tax=Desulfovibrio sp. U5L TaxID=596152 RepID=I2Q7M3_9BACT